MTQKEMYTTCFLLAIFILTHSQPHYLSTHSYLPPNIEKGENITQQMVTKIIQVIKQAATSCSAIDRSCFSQIVGLNIQKLYGKSWNIHLLQKSTTMIKGRQYSHDRWITLYNEGDPAFSYYIFKPNDCSRPLIFNPIISKNSQPQQYWGSSMTEALRTKLKSIIDEGYSISQIMDKNAEYIQNKMGPGKWQVVIWNTPSFDFLNTCMYANYFGLIVGMQRGYSVWSYYVGRMSLI